MKIHRQDWAPSNQLRLSLDHFLEADLDRTGQQVRLRNNATPIRFKKFPQHLKKVIIIEL